MDEGLLGGRASLLGRWCLCELHDGRGGGARPGDLPRQLRASRPDQEAIRSGQPLPREPEHPTGGVTPQLAPLWLQRWRQAPCRLRHARCALQLCSLACRGEDGMTGVRRTYTRRLMHWVGLLLGVIVLSMTFGEGFLRWCPASVLPAALQQGLHTAPH